MCGWVVAVWVCACVGGACVQVCVCVGGWVGCMCAGVGGCGCLLRLMINLVLSIHPGH